MTFAFIMSTIMLSGATGLLGRALYQRLAPHHQVIGLGFSRAQPPLVKVDLTDAEALSALFSKHRPEVFIHAAAERNPDQFDTDPQRSIQLNCEVTEHIAQLCTEYQCRLIFISTDYVFDGLHPPYEEGAAVNPLNLYGESKARSETLLQANYPDAAIVRIPVLYGEVSHLKESAVTTIAAQLKAGQRQFDDEAQRLPTDVNDIADVLSNALHMMNNDLSGIFHISASEKLTKLAMARAMAPLLHIDPNSLSAASVDSNAAPRPKDCQLRDTRLAPMGLTIDTDFRARIATVIAPHLSH